MAIFAEGRTIAAAAGVVNLGTGVAATPDAVFQIGSVTKVLTATLVMQLVDEGRIALDDPVQQVLPELRLADADAAPRVTIRHLLTHSSGFEGDIFTDTGDGADCLERYVELLADAPQLFPPGELFSYNNAGFCLLGRVVEVARGLPYDECLRRYLLDPLGLDRAAVSAAEAILQRAAVGHVPGAGLAAGELGVTPVWAMARSNAPAGSVLAMRARDLLTFARMHLDGGTAPSGTAVLSPTSVEAMQAPQIGLPDIGWGTSWGIGWELTETPEGTVIGHDGNTVGQSAILRVVPASGVAVAVLANGGDVSPVFAEIAGRVLSQCAGIAPPEIPVPPAEPSAPERPERFTGRYGSSTVEFELRVDDDGRLRLRRTPLAELAELGDPVYESELVAWRGDALIPLEAEGGSHRPIAFLGDDGGGRPTVLHSGRADRRVAP